MNQNAPPVPSAVANPVSHEPLRRTGSFAAATITAVVAVWATTSSNVLQSLLLSLTYAIHRTLSGCRWATVHRKQIYQRSPAHSAPHAPPTSPPRAPPPPSRRSRTCHPPASATTTSGNLARACTPRSPRYESSRETTITPGRISGNKYRQARDTSTPSRTRRRRRRRQSCPRRRRRRRRRHRTRRSPEAGHDANPEAPSVAAPTLSPLPLHRRHRPTRCSWPLRRSTSLAHRPRMSPRKCANWSTVVARAAGSPLSSTAPLEGRGSRGR